MRNIVEEAVRIGYANGQISLWSCHVHPAQPNPATQCLLAPEWILGLITKALHKDTGYTGEIMISEWLIDEITKELKICVENTLPWENSTAEAILKYLEGPNNHYSVLLHIVKDRYLEKPKRTRLQKLWEFLYRR